MKHNLFFLCLLSVSFSVSADKNNHSQFLALLAPSEPVVEKTPEKIQSKQPIESSKMQLKEEKKAVATNPFFELLRVNKTQAHKKLYKSDLDSFHFKYTNQLEYAHECQGFPSFDEKNLTDAERKDAKKYGKRIAKGYEAPWYLRCIDDQIGHGAFADADIEEGQMIGEYTGIVIETSKAKKLDMSYAWTLVPPAQHTNRAETFFVDAKLAGNFVRFINHSSYPNVKPCIVYSGGAWHMIYVAAKPIKKDEQLLVDYGAGYWNVKTCKPVELSLGE